MSAPTAPSSRFKASLKWPLSARRSSCAAADRSASGIPTAQTRRKWRRSKYGLRPEAGGARRSPRGYPGALVAALREQPAQQLLGGTEFLSGAADEVCDEVRVTHVLLGDLPLTFAHPDAVDALIHAGVRVAVLDHVCAPCLFAFPVYPVGAEPSFAR